MEVQCYSGANFGRQSFPARSLDEPRTLKWSWLETQYRRLKLRYKASRGAIAGLRAKLATTQRRLDEEMMNGMSIMACRDMIQTLLGVSAVRIPGLNINSPFFDDLVEGIIHKLISETRRADAAEAALLNVLRAPGVGQTSLNLLQVKKLLAQKALAQQQIQNNAVWYQGTSTSATTFIPTSASAAATPSFYINNAPNTVTLVTAGTAYSSTVGQIMNTEMMVDFDNIIMPDGRAGKVTLPDGTRIEIDRDGSYIIDDKDAKVVYRANRVREFNRFINASDILTKFIEFCGKESAVTRDEMLELPVNLFIQYLILEAAKADGEPEPTDLTLLPDLRKVVNCLGCDQPLPPERRIRKLHYCGPSCLEQHERRELEIAA